MRRTLIRIVVAALAFVLGTAAHTVWVGVHSYEAEIPDFRQSLVEDWHRLYEAALLSGNPELRNPVQDRLFCTNSLGVSDAWLVSREDGGMGCRKADGTVYELRFWPGSEYGAFYEEITSTHSKWVFENMEFVASISNAARAKEYVLSTIGSSGK